MYSDQVKEAKKGIPHGFKLVMDDFKQTLYGDTSYQHKVVVKSLKLNTAKQMTRTTMRKNGLSDIHIKLAVDTDRITCKPLKINGEYL